ncbi:MAG: metallophosphoesterase family protein [Trueperaceae bacterium]|nr:metallophosphoesterase family protein [Trueperaceae bacterium]
MKLGIISDVHDSVRNLRAALSGLQQVDALLVAGDLCSPFMLPILAEGYEAGPIHVVFGNNDGDRFRMERVARSYAHLELHGEAFEGTFDGLAVAMNHFPALARTMDTARYAAVVYGHDHRYRVERSDGGWWLDPGSLLGYDPKARAEVPPTFLVLDLSADRVDGYQLSRADVAERIEVTPYRP